MKDFVPTFEEHRMNEKKWKYSDKGKSGIVEYHWVGDDDEIELTVDKPEIPGKVIDNMTYCYPKEFHQDGHWNEDNPLFDKAAKKMLKEFTSLVSKAYNPSKNEINPKEVKKLEKALSDWRTFDPMSLFGAETYNGWDIEQDIFFEVKATPEEAWIYIGAYVVGKLALYIEYRKINK